MNQRVNRAGVQSMIVSVAGGASLVGVLAFAPAVLLGACGAPARASSGIATTAARMQASDDPDYGYNFDADPAQNANASPAADLSLPHGAGDRIPPETIQAILRSHYAAVASCYQAGVA